MKRKFIAALSAVAVCALLLGSYSIWHKPSGSSPVQFPTRAESNTVVLKAANSQESLRLVYYAADKTTRTGMRIEFTDGRTGVVEFSPTGNASRMTEYFPLPENMPWDTDLKKRKVLRVTDFMPDGSVVKTQSTYRSNGNVQEFAVRNSDGNLIVTVFDLDARSVQRLQTFSDSGTLTSERVFYPDGSLNSVYTATSYGGSYGGYGIWGGYRAPSYTSAKQEIFDLNGKLTRRVNWDYSSVDVIDYKSDGTTRDKQTTYSRSTVTVTSFTANGSDRYIEKQYTFNEDRTAVTSVDVKFLRNGKSSVVQTWVPLDSTLATERVGVVDQGFVLSTVVEYWADGYTHKRNINFYPGGKLVKSAEEQLTTNWEKRVIRNYREDGSLDNTQDFQWSQKIKETPMPAGPNAKREAISADLLHTEDLLPIPDFKGRDLYVVPTHPVKYNFN